jgi:NADPH:quinone reductase
MCWMPTAGFAAGEIQEVALNRVLLNNISIVGAALGAFIAEDPAFVRRQDRVINDWGLPGSVAPPVTRESDFVELPKALVNVHSAI